MRPSLSAVLIVLGALAAGAQPPAHAQGKATKSYKARLSTVPMDLTMAATVAGSGSVTAVLTGTSLAITGTFDGLKSPATIAQIHRGQTGVRGPAVFDLQATHAAKGTITGTITLTRQQIADLDKGWFYVQLHSEKAPDGNLWGWLLPETRR